MNTEQLITKLTLEEKAALVSGQGIDRLGISALKFADPKIQLPLSSFDRNLTRQLGQAQAEESSAQILITPSTQSEDLALSAQLSVAFIKGVQQTGLAAALRNFPITQSIDGDVVSIHENYLAPYEQAVKEAKPSAIVCSDTRINGISANENKWAINDVVRGEWGFKGIIYSETVDDRLESLRVGLDMAHSDPSKIIDAVQHKELEIKVLDESVAHILANLKKEEKKLGQQKNIDQKVAEESIVLLKNNSALPLKKFEQVCFVGSNAAPVIAIAEQCGYQIDTVPTSADQAVVVFDADLAKTIVHPNIVVVLPNDQPCEMPWLEKASAVISGPFNAAAIVRILFGDVNPSGKLAQSFPAFPFGHGLSYTQFAFGETEAEVDGERITVKVEVTNVGRIAGKQVVQLYSDGKLKGFEKIELQSGDTRFVRFNLTKKDFAHWDAPQSQWVTLPGDYTISVGESSKRIQSETQFHIE